MLRQQGCLLVHVTSSFLVLGLKGGFTERPCRIRTLDLHRIYLYCGTARSVSFSGSFLKFSLVTTMILSLPMNVVYASRFTSCGPNTRSYRPQTLLGQVSQWVSAPSVWKKAIFV